MEHQAVVFSHSETSGRSPAVLRVIPSEAEETSVSAALLWAELCDGTKKIESFSTKERHIHVELERRKSPGARIVGRRLRALELLFQGMTQTAIAIELGVASSTVCADLKLAMTSLGINERAFALPPFLPQIWQLAARAREVRVSTFAHERSRQTVLLPRVDLSLSEALAPAEVEVCRLLLSGRSHEQISEARRRKRRTVANQLAAVFAKMKVSGRSELVAQLVRHSTNLD